VFFETFRSTSRIPFNIFIGLMFVVDIELFVLLVVVFILVIFDVVFVVVVFVRVVLVVVLVVLVLVCKFLKAIVLFTALRT